jgi:phage RecT family recombinase
MSENKQVTPYGRFKALIETEKVRDSTAALFPLDLNPARFFGLVNNSFSKMEEKYLKALDKESALQAVAHFAAIGVYPDPVSGYGWFLPFYDYKRKVYTIQPIVGYLGMIQLIHRNPKVIDIQCEAVYANDFLEDTRGTTRTLVHTVNNFEDRGELLFSYAVIKLNTGGQVVEVCSPRHLKLMEKRFGTGKDKAGKTYLKDSQWNDDIGRPWMYRKTALNSAAKFLEKTDALSLALASERRAEYAPGENPDLIEIPPQSPTRTQDLFDNMEEAKPQGDTEERKSAWASYQKLINGEFEGVSNATVQEALHILWQETDDQIQPEDFSESDLSQFKGIMEMLISRARDQVQDAKEWANKAEGK